MGTEAHGDDTGDRQHAAGWAAAQARRERQASELRAGISLVGSAAADLGWGARPDVRVLADGRLWLDELEVAVTAAQVYQAARHLIAAQVATVAEQAGSSVGAVAGPWLLTLHTNEAMVSLDLDVQDDVA
ncbi:hypothetical protein [Modestobacter muralis]|uniref:hypothetical protein n=1 Tax=Modestobacter muralis TaxID=1608614 RepID=UPI001FE4292F|nr:hypothetical protein [Modestobacter muralis]